ncbi:MAG: hypothetical protein H5U40_04370, partial [Polyangiaceae bacterium]|nr:hypothetical protein [Polyangiaceae bacterium]
GDRITLEQVTLADARFTAGRFNGDGVITDKTPEDASVGEVVKEIIATYGSVADRTVDPGVDSEKVSAFFTDAAALLAWYDALKSGDVDRPLGDSTEARAEELRALGPKLDDYFARCRMAAFDERVIAISHGTEAELSVLASKDISLNAEEIARMPIARIAPVAPLPFEGKINPAFAEKLVSLRDRVVRPLLGASIDSLSEQDLARIRGRFAAYEAHRARKPETKLDTIAVDRLRAIVGGNARAELDRLVAEDVARKDELTYILEVEKLVYLHRDLVCVLRNFVSFTDFYAKKRAIFQSGTLYLDGRGCDLCVDVTDPATHAKLAALASTYLAYCECKRTGEPTRKIVAAFTAGDSDNLMVGRNGIFLDRNGKHWDATITLVIENPISIRQAFWAPYKRFVRLVEEQVAKRATAADAESQSRVETAAVESGNIGAAPATGASAGGAPAKRSIDVGTVAAIGVAIGGIGALITGLLSTFLGLGLFMPIGIIAITMMISAPSMLLAYLKLRRRNLGPLLDASGWAVNGLARINVPFGGVLTNVATLPLGADRILKDPYAERSHPWRVYMALALVVAPVVA